MLMKARSAPCDPKNFGKRSRDVGGRLPTGGVSTGRAGSCRSESLRQWGAHGQTEVRRGRDSGGWKAELEMAED